MNPDTPTWPAATADRYRAAGHWRGETFPQLLRDRAEAHPDRIALVDPAAGGRRRTWTYRELHRRAERLAAGLEARGIRPGDRVVVQLPNIGEFFETVFALFRLGALPVYALPAHRSAEIGHFLRAAEAKAYVVPDVHAGFDYRELATALAGELAGEAAGEAPLVLVAGEPGPGQTALADVPLDAPVAAPGPRPDDLAFLQLSGGTTGVPKLIPRTHDDYIYSLRGSVEICGIDADTVFMVTLPAAHNFPMSSPGHLGALYGGARVVLCPAPQPDTAFPLIEQERVTMTGLVPPLALVWLDAARNDLRHDLSSLDVLQVGGAKFSAEAARRVRPVLDCTLQQVFGMAEGLVNYTRLDDDEETVATTQGRPISPDDEVRVVDADDNDLPPGATGRLLTRGPYTIRGYYRAEEHNREAFTADGFYRTGDLVRRTEGGNLVVEGRVKDQINRGGEKVAAEEVENAILGHPDVLDAAVVSMPDTYLGERTCAYVILRAGAAAARARREDGFLRPAAIVRQVRERGLAAYKVPDRVEFVEEFPATGIGKTSKRELRAAIAARLRAGADSGA